MHKFVQTFVLRPINYDPVVNAKVDTAELSVKVVFVWMAKSTYGPVVIEIPPTSVIQASGVAATTGVGTQ